MNELDLDGIEPMARVETRSNVLRVDRVEAFAYPDELLGEAPLMERDMVRVPKILAESD